MSSLERRDFVKVRKWGAAQWTRGDRVKCDGIVVSGDPVCVNRSTHLTTVKDDPFAVFSR